MRGAPRQAGAPRTIGCWGPCRGPSCSSGQTVVDAVDVARVEARGAIGRRQRLVVEELRQLVVLLAEARALVELFLQLERLLPQRGEELLRVGRPARRVERVDDERSEE